MARISQPRGRSRQTTSFIRSPFARSLHCEQLEDRRMLSVLTVTTDQDVVDFNDGITSLREAIFAANTVPGPDEIQFDFGHNGPATILLEQGELAITDSLTITGLGADLLAIDAQRQSRIFDATGFVGDVTLVGMTLTNGRTIDDQEGGGAIRTVGKVRLSIEQSAIRDNSTLGDSSRGGAILSNGVLQIRESVISGNFTTGMDASGGAVYARPLTLIDSLVSENRTIGISSQGGGIVSARGNYQVAKIERSQIVNNETIGDQSPGGGIVIWSGKATISDSSISGNITVGLNSSGGAISSFSDLLTITSSTILDNSALGLYAHGGGLLLNGYFTSIESSTISHNSSTSGGGGIFSEGNLSLTYSELSNNIATGRNMLGGGIHVSRNTTIADSTISGNKAIGQASLGGGIFSDGYLQISSSTISGNATKGTNGQGGGIASVGPLVISYSTVVENQAMGAGSIGGGVLGAYGSIHHSIIANNKITTTDSDLYWQPQRPKFSFSLIGTNTDTNLTEAPVGSPDAHDNLIGGPIHGVIDPLLGPLADNGGPTLTHAVLPGSPALDAGDPNDVAGQNGVPLFDQRGTPFGRVAGERIDIGAFESGPLIVDTLVDENDGDFSPGDLSLREAIDLTNRIAGANTIEFSPLLAGSTILLTMGELKISDSLDVMGLGAELLTIDANGSPGSIFEINDSIESNLIETKFEGLTLTGATNSAIHTRENLIIADAILRNNQGTQGGAIRVDNFSGKIPGIELAIYDSHFFQNHANVNAKSQGGVIYFVASDGELIISGSTFQGNSAALHGGAVYATTSTDVSIVNSDFLENSAEYGGGIFLIGNDGKLATIENSTFRENLATQSGGAIHSGKNMSIRNSSITGNQSLGVNDEEFQFYGGGGIFQGGTFLSIVDSVISGNSSSGDGGGLSSLSRRNYLTNTSVNQNSAQGKGGGINIRYGQLELQTTVVSDNSSGVLGGGGIYAETSWQGVFSIQDSTISNNRTQGDGGGVSGKNLTITNSTISGNQAFGSGGGLAIYSGYYQEMAHSTVSNNTADADEDGIGSGGGLFSRNLYNLNHSIIAGNHDKSGIAHDVAGIISASFSLIGYGAEFLGPLADNGGPTLTHALLPGSPAINAGEPTSVDGEFPEFDQRGAPFARIVGGRIDIGAYESQPSAGTFTGDFDADGDVDGRDFLSWQRGFGKTGDAMQSDGDATGNLAVDGNDLAVWQATYGEVPSAVSSQLSANDAKMEAFANLSAGVPALFAQHSIATRDEIPSQETYPFAEFSSYDDWQLIAPRKSQSNLPPLASSWDTTSSEKPFIQLEGLSALDEVFAAL